MSSRTKRYVQSSPLKHYRLPESRQLRPGKARKAPVSKHAGQRKAKR